MAKVVNSWPEIATARAEHRHELRLSGADVARRLAQANGELPTEIFNIRTLNYLEISKASLAAFTGADLTKLKYLTTLVLHTNLLSEIPGEIALLEKLKHFDVSFNQLTALPVEMEKLGELQVLNVSHNQLSALPSLASFPGLLTLDASFNELTEFPVRDASECQHLSLLNLKHNKIGFIPGLISGLSSGLRSLNLEANAIEIVPTELADCVKIKELSLGENKLKDRRLQKMLDGCKLHSIMEYIGKNCPKAAKAPTSASAVSSVTAYGEGEAQEVENEESGVAMATVKNAKGKRTRRKSSEGENAAAKLLPKIEVQRAAGDFVVSVTKDVLFVRAYIVCCVVRNLNLQGANFKSFIKLQTKLHEGICKNRVAATIATHDLKLIRAPISYTTRKPKEIQIKPLRGGATAKLQAADELVETLKAEAEQLRKEKKRNTYSGVHQYLYLLKPLTRYAILVDADGAVISLPPITNSDHTKISQDTVDILLEVTSSESLGVCKKVADAVLHEMVLRKLGASSESENASEQAVAAAEKGPQEESTPQSLTVQQVKILTAEDESMKVVYPSKPDLDFDDVESTRHYE